MNDPFNECLKDDILTVSVITFHLHSLHRESNRMLLRVSAINLNKMFLINYYLLIRKNNFIIIYKILKQ